MKLILLLTALMAAVSAQQQETTGNSKDFFMPDFDREEASIVLTDDNFNQTEKMYQNMFIFLYAPWW